MGEGEEAATDGIFPPPLSSLLGFFPVDFFWGNVGMRMRGIEPPPPTLRCEALPLSASGQISPVCFRLSWRGRGEKFSLPKKEKGRCSVSVCWNCETGNIIVAGPLF